MCIYYSNVDAWRFSSHCFPLEAHAGRPDCTSNGIFHADRCFGRQGFDAGQRESVLSGEMGLITLPCRCYELNCTAEMAEIEFEFPESPTFVNLPEDTSKLNIYVAINQCTSVKLLNFVLTYLAFYTILIHSVDACNARKIIL